MFQPIEYYQYYDKIFINKNYDKEVAIIMEIARDILRSFPHKILDIGCGTGSHDFIFAKNGCQVIGFDYDREIIRKAIEKSEKFGENSPQFYTGDISTIQQRDFDMIVSLFNVVNYIQDVAQLIKFFKAVYQYLKVDGVYIFDCWNGIAAIIDPPKIKESNIQMGKEIISIKSKPTIDLFRQNVFMKNEVLVESENENKQFSFEYTQKLWTPACLCEILELVGFQILNISVWMKPQIPASEHTWKIMFSCKKES